MAMTTLEWDGHRVRLPVSMAAAFLGNVRLAGQKVERPATAAAQMALAVGKKTETTAVMTKKPGTGYRSPPSPGSARAREATVYPTVPPGFRAVPYRSQPRRTTPPRPQVSLRRPPPPSHKPTPSRVSPRQKSVSPRTGPPHAQPPRPAPKWESARAARQQAQQGSGTPPGAAPLKPPKVGATTSKDEGLFAHRRPATASGPTFADRIRNTTAAPTTTSARAGQQPPRRGTPPPKPAAVGATSARRATGTVPPLLLPQHERDGFAEEARVPAQDAEHGAFLSALEAEMQRTEADQAVQQLDSWATGALADYRRFATEQYRHHLAVLADSYPKAHPKSRVYWYCTGRRADGAPCTYAHEDHDTMLAHVRRQHAEPTDPQQLSLSPYHGGMCDDGNACAIASVVAVLETAMPDNVLESTRRAFRTRTRADAGRLRDELGLAGPTAPTRVLDRIKELRARAGAAATPPRPPSEEPVISTVAVVVDPSKDRDGTEAHLVEAASATLREYPDLLFFNIRHPYGQRRRTGVREMPEVIQIAANNGLGVTATYDLHGVIDTPVAGHAIAHVREVRQPAPWLAPTALAWHRYDGAAHASAVSAPRGGDVVMLAYRLRHWPPPPPQPPTPPPTPRSDVDADAFSEAGSEYSFLSSESDGAHAASETGHRARAAGHRPPTPPRMMQLEDGEEIFGGRSRRVPPLPPPPDTTRRRTAQADEDEEAHPDSDSGSISTVYDEESGPLRGATEEAATGDTAPTNRRLSFPEDDVEEIETDVEIDQHDPAEYATRQLNPLYPTLRLPRPTWRTPSITRPRRRRGSGRKTRPTDIPIRETPLRLFLETLPGIGLHATDTPPQDALTEVRGWLCASEAGAAVFAGRHTRHSVCEKCNPRGETRHQAAPVIIGIRAQAEALRREEIAEAIELALEYRVRDPGARCGGCGEPMLVAEKWITGPTVAVVMLDVDDALRPTTYQEAPASFRLPAHRTTATKNLHYHSSLVGAVDIDVGSGRATVFHRQERGEYLVLSGAWERWVPGAGNSVVVRDRDLRGQVWFYRKETWEEYETNGDAYRDRRKTSAPPTARRQSTATKHSMSAPPARKESHAARVAQRLVAYDAQAPSTPTPPPPHASPHTVGQAPQGPPAPPVPHQQPASPPPQPPHAPTPADQQGDTEVTLPSVGTGEADAVLRALRAITSQQLTTVQDAAGPTTALASTRRWLTSTEAGDDLLHGRYAYTCACRRCSLSSERGDTHGDAVYPCTATGDQAVMTDVQNQMCVEAESSGPPCAQCGGPLANVTTLAQAHAVAIIFSDEDGAPRTPPAASLPSQLHLPPRTGDDGVRVCPVVSLRAVITLANNAGGPETEDIHATVRYTRRAADGTQLHVTWVDGGAPVVQAPPQDATAHVAIYVAEGASVPLDTLEGTRRPRDPTATVPPPTELNTITPPRPRRTVFTWTSPPTAPTPHTPHQTAADPGTGATTAAPTRGPQRGATPPAPHAHGIAEGDEQHPVVISDGGDTDATEDDEEARARAALFEVSSDTSMSDGRRGEEAGAAEDPTPRVLSEGLGTDDDARQRLTLASTTTSGDEATHRAPPRDPFLSAPTSQHQTPSLPPLRPPQPPTPVPPPPETSDEEQPRHTPPPPPRAETRTDTPQPPHGKFAHGCSIPPGTEEDLNCPVCGSAGRGLPQRRRQAMIGHLNRHHLGESADVEALKRKGTDRCCICAEFLLATPQARAAHLTKCRGNPTGSSRPAASPYRASIVLDSGRGDADNDDDEQQDAHPGALPHPQPDTPADTTAGGIAPALVRDFRASDPTEEDEAWLDEVADTTRSLHKKEWRRWAETVGAVLIGYTASPPEERHRRQLAMTTVVREHLRRRTDAEEPEAPENDQRHPDTTDAPPPDAPPTRIPRDDYGDRAITREDWSLAPRVRAPVRIDPAAPAPHDHGAEEDDPASHAADPFAEDDRSEVGPEDEEERTKQRSRILNQLMLGALGKAARSLFGRQLPRVPLRDALPQLDNLHPQENVRGLPLPPSTPYAFTVKPERVRAVILKSLGRASAPGLDGWTRELLVPLTEQAALLRELTTLVQDMLVGEVSDSFATRLRACILHPFRKEAGSVKVRPITPESTLLKVAAHIALDTVPREFKNTFRGWQYGVWGDSAEAVASIRQAYADEGVDTLIALDASNAYNSMSRAHILAAAYEQPALERTFGIVNMSLGAAGQLGVYERGRRRTQLASTKGVRQGMVLSPLLFANAMAKVLRPIMAQHSGVHVVAYLDDVTLVGRQERVQAFLDEAGPALAAIGFTANALKSHHLTKRAADEIVTPVMIGATAIPVARDTVRILGAGFRGDEASVEAWVTRKTKEYTPYFDALRVPDWLPALARFQLLRGSTLPRLTHLLRTHRPEELARNAAWFDDEVKRTFATITEAPVAGDVALALAQLPLAKGGLGLRSQASIATFASACVGTKNAQRARTAELDNTVEQTLHTLLQEPGLTLVRANTAAGATRALVDPAIHLSDEATRVLLKQRLMQRVLPEGCRCECGADADNAHVNTCQRIRGGPRIARHNRVVTAVAQWAAEMGWSSTTEPRTDAADSRKRLDIRIVTPDSVASTDVTVVYPARRGDHGGGDADAEDAHPNAKQRRASKLQDAHHTKLMQWAEPALTEGTDFTPLAMESTGGIHRDGFKWLRRLAGAREHPYTPNTALSMLLSKIAESLHMGNAHLFQTVDKQWLNAQTRHSVGGAL